MRLLTRISMVLIALAVFLPATTALAQQGSDLRSAYKKEFAYLESQKRALQERLEKLERSEEQQVAGAQAELDRLQGRLLSLRMQADKLEDDVMEAERNAQQGAGGGDVVATTIEQANSSIGKFGVKVEVPGAEEAGEQPDEASEDESASEGDSKRGGAIRRAQEADYAAAVEELFAKSAGLMERHSSLRKEEGEFFLADGSKTRGRIVRVGNVAAYGVSDQAAGALAPAGDRRLKLWKKNAADTAQGLAAGKSPELVDVFLFESIDKAVEEQEEKTWLDIVNSGGIIAWVIVGLGVLGLLLVIARAFVLGIAGANTRRLLETVSAFVEKGKVEQAREACESARGSASRVLGATLAHLGEEREELEDVVNESILHEMPTLERFGSTILVFAAVAPLLGLLGTVTGMISTFDIITEFGTGDPKLLSGGISEALVTTQLGLIVAIPLLLVGNLLKGWSNSIMTQLERGALRVMNLANLQRPPTRSPDTSSSEVEVEAKESTAGADASVDASETTDLLGAV
ncbi:MAG: MotA/TolQ/ExbB proton channel family protein [Myxococcota bacterium]